MDPLEAIRRAQATRLVEDGDELELGPALSPAEIERLGDEVEVPLPRELRALLGHTAGIDGGPLETIDFTGRSLSLGSEAFPWGLPIAGDGFGNFWRDNPGTLERSAALAGDEHLRAFAAELDDRFTFVDLRSPPVGWGFSRRRYGPRTDVRRHGHERLFAYAPPDKRPGLLRRLFA